MTFLEIVKAVARRTGTLDPRNISSAIGASGRVGTFAALVQDAWTQIQGEHEQWRFLVSDLPDTAMLTQGVRAVTPASLNLTNWASWIPGDARGTVRLSAWPDKTDGRLKERPLTTLDYRAYRETYESGSFAVNPVTGQPTIVTVDTHDRLAVWPVPDVDYRLAGTYRRQPQVFAADTDEPLIEVQHQNTIVSAGALWVHRYDETDANTLFTAKQSLDADLANLRRRYLYGTRVIVGAAPVGPTGQRGVRSLFPFPNLDDDRGRIE